MNRRASLTIGIACLLAFCIGGFQNCSKFNANPTGNPTVAATTSSPNPAPAPAPNPTPSPPSPTPSPSPSPGPAKSSVLQYHNSSNRSGLYVDAAFTKASAAGLHADPSFTKPKTGTTYANPVYLKGAPNLLIVATEQNNVFGINADTGAIVWKKNVGTPVPLSSLPCGNINTLGITGTPVINETSRTIYLDAMAGDSGSPKHMVYALNADTGAVKSGWPLDVSTVSAGSVQFNAPYQNQRGALLLLNGTVYIPYGGHWADCGDFHGWVVSVPENNPAAAKGWATTASEGGIWGPPGLASDGQSIFAATGNTGGTSTWGGGEAMIRVAANTTFSGTSQDFFAPTNWKALDDADIDTGSSGSLLIDIPAATPSHLAFLAGKDGNIYLLNRDNLGGISAPTDILKVSGGYIKSGAAVYVSGSSTYLTLDANNGTACPSGQSGEVVAVKITSASPPKMSVGWCASQGGNGSPVATSPDGTTDFVVWGLGAGGDNKLHAFDGLTGQSLFTSAAMDGIQPFQSPIIANGHVYVSTNSQIYSFMP